MMKTNFVLRRTPSAATTGLSVAAMFFTLELAVVAQPMADVLIVPSTQFPIDSTVSIYLYSYQVEDSLILEYSTDDVTWNFIDKLAPRAVRRPTLPTLPSTSS